MSCLDEAYVVEFSFPFFLFCWIGTSIMILKRYVGFFTLHVISIMRMHRTIFRYT